MEAILSNNVLVLNRLWQAVNICSVKRAFMLLYQGHAQVVEAESGTFQTMTFDQWYSFSRGYEGSDVVSTVSFTIRVPKVILLLFFDRMPKKEVKFTRHNIFERDHNTCQYCGHKFDRKDLNLDHVIPRHRGGRPLGRTSSVPACRATAGRGTGRPRRRGCDCCISRSDRSGGPCCTYSFLKRKTSRGSTLSIWLTGMWSCRTRILASELKWLIFLGLRVFLGEGAELVLRQARTGLRPEVDGYLRGKATELILRQAQDDNAFFWRNDGKWPSPTDTLCLPLQKRVRRLPVRFSLIEIELN